MQGKQDFATEIKPFYICGLSWHSVLWQAHQKVWGNQELENLTEILVSALAKKSYSASLMRLLPISHKMSEQTAVRNYREERELDFLWR